jgi:hypothetical protein
MYNKPTTWYPMFNVGNNKLGQFYVNNVTEGIAI